MRSVEVSAIIHSPKKFRLELEAKNEREELSFDDFQAHFDDGVGIFYSDDVPIFVCYNKGGPGIYDGVFGITTKPQYVNIKKRRTYLTEGLGEVKIWWVACSNEIEARLLKAGFIYHYNPILNNRNMRSEPNGSYTALYERHHQQIEDILERLRQDGWPNPKAKQTEKMPI